MPIKINWEGVAIGSRTLEEYKCQVLNFMNMFYSNIHYSDGKKEFSTGRCMTVSVVHGNLLFEIRRAFCEEQKLRTIWVSKEDYICSLVDAIYMNLRHCTTEDFHTKEVRNHCDQMWHELLRILTSELKLEQFIF